MDQGHTTLGQKTRCSIRVGDVSTVAAKSSHHKILSALDRGGLNIYSLDVYIAVRPCSVESRLKNILLHVFCIFHRPIPTLVSSFSELIRQD